jgi:hypothetical protein
MLVAWVMLQPYINAKKMFQIVTSNPVNAPESTPYSIFSGKHLWYV